MAKKAALSNGQGDPKLKTVFTAAKGMKKGK